MKPLYIFLLLYALFITGLTCGVSAGLVLIPGVGIALALVFSFCINVTMGSGLMLLLVTNGMYHPTWGPAGFIGSLIPGLDFLPFWLGIVIAGIVQDMSKEGGLAGKAIGLVQTATAAASGNVTGTVQGIKNTTLSTKPVTIAQAPANDSETPQEHTRPTLQTKNFDGITRAANDNFKPYVQKAA
ncbi:MAG: hypothetical protein ABSE76_01650 [Minisyncoccia bacterium]|jgi:hypothetical protein